MLLQQLVDRDAAKLAVGLERLEVVIGFDGAENFMHVMMHLIDYLPEMAKASPYIAITSISLLSTLLLLRHHLANTCHSQESELKGVGLAVAMGDDHNSNLALVFRRLGPDINAAIAQGHTVRKYLATT